MTIDVSIYSIAQLEALAEQVQEEIKRKRAVAKKQLMADLERVARDAGVSLAELFGDKAAPAAKKPRAAVAAKYRNPNNPDQTWSGRGRQPVWLAALLADGHTLSSLAI